MFTGLLGQKRPGEYPFLAIDEDGVDGEGSVRRGRPPSGRMRREIPFDDLPGVQQTAVLDAYRRLWGL